MDNKSKNDVFSEKYILWLNDFCERNHSFMDSDWKFGFRDLPVQDQMGILQLKDFYSFINDYAFQHGVPAVHHSFSSSYFVSCGEDKFEIGIFVGDPDQPSMFCNKIYEYHEDMSFIDFSDAIMEQGVSVNYKRNKLKKMVKKIKE